MKYQSKAFARDVSGATASEYRLIAVGISVAVTTVDTFSSVGGNLANAGQ